MIHNGLGVHSMSHTIVIRLHSFPLFAMRLGISVALLIHASCMNQVCTYTNREGQIFVMYKPVESTPCNAKHFQLINTYYFKYI